MRHRIRRRRVPLRAQAYEHRIECAVQALRLTVSGARKMAEYLAEQQGTDWASLDRLLGSAEKDLRVAGRWLRNARS